MEHPFDFVASAVLLFVSTDLDDFFVLLGFFSDPSFRARHIAAGQAIGIATLYGISAAGSLISLIVPTAVVGLLGLVPITMGLKKAWDLVAPPDADAKSMTGYGTTRAWPNIAAVLVVTLANGADNLSVYIPLFAMHSAPDIALIGIVFAIMTAIWLGFAHWLTHRCTISAAVRRYVRILMPFILVALGALILSSAGTLRLLRRQ